ncbi:nuclear transport factor 2 family protein [Chryseobacterium oryctis]|uniref:Ester cyclase n=1 Tax=Chryseobacterium oryctis TaxID=2952618 RepID=A0ABT3HRT9_9FLAO|nr:ester cyclase [Chryseobacterium oryctis]MCW3162503.1 ester cyclase [Chryseobacterium oryctis]
MEIIINHNDKEAVRNSNSLLALYEEMINKKEPLKSVRKYIVPEYIQHNPFLPTGADGTGKAFEDRLVDFPNMSVEVYKIIASGNYVWAHVKFKNIYSNDTNDLGVAGVDIFKFNHEGKITEHWDVLQSVPELAQSANTNGMF